MGAPALGSLPWQGWQVSLITGRAEHQSALVAGPLGPGSFFFPASLCATGGGVAASLFEVSALLPASAAGVREEASGFLVVGASSSESSSSDVSGRSSSSSPADEPLGGGS